MVKHLRIQRKLMRTYGCVTYARTCETHKTMFDDVRVSFKTLQDVLFRTPKTADVVKLAKELEKLRRGMFSRYIVDIIRHYGAKVATVVNNALGNAIGKRFVDALETVIVARFKLDHVSNEDYALGQDALDFYFKRAAFSVDRITCSHKRPRTHVVKRQSYKDKRPSPVDVHALVYEPPEACHKLNRPARNRQRSGYSKQLGREITVKDLKVTNVFFV